MDDLSSQITEVLLALAAFPENLEEHCHIGIRGTPTVTLPRFSVLVHLMEALQPDGVDHALVVYGHVAAQIHTRVLGHVGVDGFGFRPS